MIRLPRTTRTPRMPRDEDGIVVVWFALTLVVLLGSAAFAIDVANWHFTHTKEQRAADAAALAGAVTFPGDASASNVSALGVAGANGYPLSATQAFGPDGECALGTADTVMCTGQGDRPFQYKVKIVRRVNNLFGGILGADSTKVGAIATAEFLRPLSMGSPSNQFGNDPDGISSWPLPSGTPPQAYPNFWANIAGGSSTKQNGDAYAAGQCVAATDGCNGTGIGASNDFKPGGYSYAVNFTENATVNLQAFDPAFVRVGDNCTDGAANLAAAAALANVPLYPSGVPRNFAQRYAPVTNASNQSDPGFRYCTGDMLFGSGPAPATTFRVMKALVPGDPSSAQQVCGPVTYPGYSGDVSTPLRNGQTLAGAPAPFATYFRQWVNLCQVTGDAGDQFFVEVTTNAGSQGHNRFALRGQGGSGSAPVNVSGNAYMGIYANVGTRLTQFHLARVPSAAAGHTLVLNFFDIGDAASGSIGTLTIVPPTDSNVGSTFSGCTWSGNATSGATGFANNTRLAPWGPLTSIPLCQVTGVNNNSANWNGQWSTVQIPIPANYSCDDDDVEGCWLKINYLFTGGVNDTTSWNAYLLGDPVRLVK